MILFDAETFEEQQQMFKQPWFSEVVRFCFYIYNPDAFNAEDIDDFIINFQSIPARNYRDAYQMIGQRLLVNISSLAERLKSNGRIHIDSLWGSNLVYQILTLIDERPAVTTYGKKVVVEKRKSLELQQQHGSYHGGD